MPTRQRLAVSAGTLFCILLTGAGCGAPLQPPPNDNGTDTDQPFNGIDGGVQDESVQFNFAEDSDPLIAALPFAEDELLARILPGAAEDDLQQAYDEAGATVTGDIPAIQTAVLRVDPSQLASVARALSISPVIESVHKSYFYDVNEIPNDPEFDRQNHLEALGMAQAWEITTGDPDMIIAIVDTGVEPTHPDLEARLVAGWNIYDDNGDSDDVLGHGTGVAGSVGAVSDNRLGVAGVTWDNPIMPVRVSSGSGRASSRNIAAGIVWAVDHGAKIINASFAPLGSDSTVLAAAQYARNSGTLVCISAGNSGKSYQAVANENAIFVGAVDESGDLASFSDTGPYVDFVAPGTRIRTTGTDGDYRRANGTSFSSPIVAGVAALVWSVNPDFRPVTVVDILADTAIDLGRSGRDDRFGAGMIDAAAAVEEALAVIEPADGRSPSVTIIQPDEMEIVSGHARVSVGAFDRGGVADVVLSVDGVPFATDTAKPYRFTINTDKLANGVHTLTVVATDVSGNVSDVTSVRIRVEGSSYAGGGTQGGGGASGDTGSPSESDAGEDVINPTATINSPVAGSSVFSSVGIQATVTDNVGLRSAEWLVDGARQKMDRLTGTRQVVNFVWNASIVAKGPHRITIRVQDTSRNEATTAIVLVKE